ncbi:hypothetical protein [Bremerella sp.]|uniref:hypothetical protein n=1 Tax=Bremerella sp. TaxID=2795602 RepID=UPI003919824B
MNTDIMKTVERVVRPLPCDKTHKNRMRADLYSQLERIFEEELAKDNDQAAALGRAKVRFGEPVPLQKELRAALPSLQQWQTALDRWITGQREGMSTLRYAAGFGLRTAGVLLLFFTVMVGFGTFYLQDPIIMMVWPLFLAIASLFGTNCFTHIILGELGLSAFEVDSRGVLLMKTWRLAVAAVGAGFSVTFSFFVLIKATSAGVYGGWVLGAFVLPMVSTIVLFLIVVGLLAQVELEDRRWSQLQLD